MSSSLAIHAYLLHRYPSLFIDKILRVIPDECIVALKNVSINESFFQGHFPELPIMPGSIILEAMSQAASLLVNYSACQSQLPNPNTPYLLAAWDRVKFKKTVHPGDQLIITAKIKNKKLHFIKFQLTAKVDNAIVCTAEMIGSQSSHLELKHETNSRGR